MLNFKSSANLNYPFESYISPLHSVDALLIKLET